MPHHHSLVDLGWLNASCSIFLRQPVGQLLTESLDRPDFDSSHGFFDRPHIYDQMTTFSRYHSPRGLLIKQGGHILLKRLSGKSLYGMSSRDHFNFCNFLHEHRILDYNNDDYYRDDLENDSNIFLDNSCTLLILIGIRIFYSSKLMTKKWQRASKDAKKLGSPSKKNTQKCKAKDTSSSSEDDSNQDNSDDASNRELR
ncbi:hypothetical protein WN943_026903 [Citrus x changshan-huyou]